MKQSRSLLLSCTLALALTHCSAVGAIDGRQISALLPSTTSTTSATTTGSTAATGTSTATTTSTSPATTTSQTSTSTSVSTTSTSSTTSTTTSSTTSSTTASPTSTPPAQLTSTSISTDPNGGVATVVITQSDTSTPTSSTTSSAAAASDTSDDSDDSSSGLSTGSIIGLSVAGGVALLGIVSFFIWKFTRKRFSDFDDNEAIKWPELNAHSSLGGDSHALPVHNTGRAGFGDTASEVSLSRVPSTNTNNYSTADLGGDPYAVPPLPHLNPNQPYRDDPGAINPAYYDPYRGPVPNTFDPVSPPEWQRPGEAIPMTQLNVGPPPAGRMSPGPNAGRMSPGPNLAYAGEPGRASPSINRMASPGPQHAYGPDLGRRSPGPNMAYGPR